MSLSNQATVRQRWCFKWPRPFWAKWKSPQISLIDSHVKSIFSQDRAVFENLDSYLDPCQFIFISTPTKRSFFQRANRVVALNRRHLDRICCRYTMVVLWGIVVPHIAHAQTQTVYGIRLNIITHAQTTKRFTA